MSRQITFHYLLCHRILLADAKEWLVFFVLYTNTETIQHGNSIKTQSHPENISNVTLSLYSSLIVLYTITRQPPTDQ